MLDVALVLNGPPDAGLLDEAVVATVRAFLPGRADGEESWLARGEAWEAALGPLSKPAASEIRDRVRAALGSAPVDVNVVSGEAARRRKRLLVADMESTIIREECLDEIAARAGLGERIAAITRRAMQGEVAFEAALRERVALLAGLDAGLLDDVYAGVTLMPGAATLVATMRRNGAVCALVSGGFSFFAERVAARLSFDVAQANRLEIVDGKLAGRVAEPVLGREAKRAALIRLAAERGIDLSDTLAVGDGANDLAMVETAGLGVAFRAKPVLAQAAPALIVHGDLTALLYLQGYRRAEFSA